MSGDQLHQEYSQRMDKIWKALAKSDFKNELSDYDRKRMFEEPRPVFNKENAKLAKSVPYDPRFPNQNQTRNCWQNYVDYHRCANLKGDDFAPCRFFYKNFKALCPMEWVTKWDEQREEGAFPTKL